MTQPQWVGGACRWCRHARRPYPYWECWAGRNPKPTVPTNVCPQYEREPGSDDAPPAKS